MCKKNFYFLFLLTLIQIYFSIYIFIGKLMNILSMIFISLSIHWDFQEKKCIRIVKDVNFVFFVCTYLYSSMWGMQHFIKKSFNTKFIILTWVVPFKLMPTTFWSLLWNESLSESLMGMFFRWSVNTLNQSPTLWYK